MKTWNGFAESSIGQFSRSSSCLRFSLTSGRLPHVYARPYDILLRGMGTEANGIWAERAWLFMVLCRQIGIDTGLITYSKSNTLNRVVPKYGADLDRGPRSPIVWICTALIDNNAYLFDARLGLEIPGPDGKGVATLEDALNDSAILDRMNLPGLAPYATSRALLMGSPTKIGILIDSTQGYFSPKMKLLQRELSGRHRTILYCDPAGQRDHFASVLGRWAGAVSLWPLPLEVETRLFTDASYVTSVQSSLFLFRPEYPLIYAARKATARRYRGSDRRLQHQDSISGKRPSCQRQGKENCNSQRRSGWPGRLRYVLSCPGTSRTRKPRPCRTHVPEDTRAPARAWAESTATTLCFAAARTPTWAGSTRPRKILPGPLRITSSATPQPSTWVT